MPQPNFLHPEFKSEMIYNEDQKMNLKKLNGFNLSPKKEDVNKGA